MALRYLISVLVLAGCGGQPKARPTAQPLTETLNNHLYVVVSDFTTGGVRKVDLRTGRWDDSVLPAHADALARWNPFTNQLLVLNRLAGNHLSLAGPALDLEKQFPFNLESNPQDILPLGSGDAYVSFLHDTHLRRLNLQTGQSVGKGVDLSRWKDADGFAEAAYLYAGDSRVAVSLQQLDTSTYEPGGPGVLVVIDPSTDAVDDSLTRTLAHSNPFTEFKSGEGDVFLGEAGRMDRVTPVLDGGIERLDAGDFHSKGIVITEAALGGDILDFEILSSRQGVAIVSTPQTDVVLFDPQTGEKTKRLLAGGGYRFSQVLVDRGRSLFYLADRLSEKPAIRVFDYEGVEKTQSRLELQLPPFKIVLAP
jgi:hypothetical protein